MWATSMIVSGSTVSGWSHGPLTFARNTVGAHVTQKREWMHFFAS